MSRTDKFVENFKVNSFNILLILLVKEYVTVPWRHFKEFVSCKNIMRRKESLILMWSILWNKSKFLCKFQDNFDRFNESQTDLFQKNTFQNFKLLGIP